MHPAKFTSHPSHRWTVASHPTPLRGVIEYVFNAVVTVTVMLPVLVAGIVITLVVGLYVALPAGLKVTELIVWLLGGVTVIVWAVPGIKLVGSAGLNVTPGVEDDEFETVKFLAVCSIARSRKIAGRTA